MCFVSETLIDGDGCCCCCCCWYFFLSLVHVEAAPVFQSGKSVHDVALNFSRAGTRLSSREGPQLRPHSPVHLALPLAWDCNKK